MFDLIQINDCGENIEEIGYKLIDSKVFPNPVINILIIAFDNKNNSLFEITLIDNTGKIVKNINDIIQSPVSINIQELSPGIYYYKLINKTNKKNAFGKFIKK